MFILHSYCKIFKGKYVIFPPFGNYGFPFTPALPCTRVYNFQDRSNILEAYILGHRAIPGIVYVLTVEFYSVPCFTAVGVGKDPGRNPENDNAKVNREIKGGEIGGHMRSRLQGAREEDLLNQKEE